MQLAINLIVAKQLEMSDMLLYLADVEVAARELVEQLLSMQTGALLAREMRLVRAIESLDHHIAKTDNTAVDIARRMLFAYKATPLIAWPNDKPHRYNGSGTPCDMWTGPCSCGATHKDGK